MGERGDGVSAGTTARARPGRIFRAMVMWALAGAPAACGPSQGEAEEPRPAGDAGAAADMAAYPAYGVPVEPYQPVVSEYAVVEPPEREAVTYYGAPDPGR